MSQRNNNYKAAKKPGGSKKRRSTGKRPVQQDKKWTSDSMHVEDRDGTFSSSKNDWRWYATNEQLVKDSASYPFSYALGSQIKYGPYGVDASKTAIPGVCSLAFTPTVGYSDQTNSPINIASRKIFSDMRKANAGATNYDPVDMMIYLTALDSAYFMVEHYKRAYGMSRSVSPVNRYYPRAIIEAMGFDYDSLVANLDDFRAMINTYVQKLKALAIPNGMSYMAKHQWLCSGVYQDRPTDKSQLYIFVPKAYYVFDLDASGAGYLRGKQWTRCNFTQAKAVLDSIIDPILANQDFAIMSGDILKWRGDGGVVVPTGITETYQIFPIYDESVLDQIQNATIVGVPSFYNSTSPYDPTSPYMPDFLTVFQDANKEYLVSTPIFLHPWAFNSGTSPNPGRNSYMSRKLVNFVHDSVQPQEVMEATRLTNIGVYYRSSGDGKDYFRFPTMGSEVISDAYFWYYKMNAHSEWVLDSWKVASFSDVMSLTLDSQGMNASDFQYTVDELQDFIKEINFISDFNRHPFIAFSAAAEDDSTVVASVYGPWVGYNGDVDYYTVVDDQDLTQMSEVALLSQFNVRMET